ncbi:MAG: hypothetical protein AMXMBFR34_11250 [Myxococcaceae bacterium]
MKTLGIVIALSLAGCSTPLVQLKKELGPRASQYLECGEKELEYEELEKMISSTKVKVTGCGKEAIYRLEESRWKLQQGGEN